MACYDSDRDCRQDYEEDFVASPDESQVYLLLLSPSLFSNPYLIPGERFSLVRKELRYAGDLEAEGKINFVILSLLPFDYAGKSEMERFYAAHTAGFHKIPYLPSRPEEAFEHMVFEEA